MKFIDRSYKIIPQAPGLVGMKKQIEAIGRTCYFSNNLITDDSYEKFVDRMIRSEHYAMLEFGTIYLTIDEDSEVMREVKENSNCGELAIEAVGEYIHNINVAKFSRVNFSKGIHYITTNFSVIIEHGLEHILQYIEL